MRQRLLEYFIPMKEKYFLKKRSSNACFTPAIEKNGAALYLAERRREKKKEEGKKEKKKIKS